MSILNIIFIFTAIYVVRIIISPVIVYTLGAIWEWIKQWYNEYEDNIWWFKKGTKVKDIIENVRNQCAFEGYYDAFFIPIGGLLTFLMYVIYTFIISIVSIIIVIPLVLIIEKLIIPLFKYILIPIFKYIIAFIITIYDILRMNKLCNNIKNLYSIIIDKILNMKIA